jgi:hypothetical protein
MVRFVQRGKILNLLNTNFQEHYFFQFLKNYYSMFLLSMLKTCKVPSISPPLVFGGISRLVHHVSF